MARDAISRQISTGGTNSPALARDEMNPGGYPKHRQPMARRYPLHHSYNETTFLIKRVEKFGGNLEFNSYKELEEAFASGLHPLDLKNATTNYVNKILEPVHAYFENHPDNYNKMKEEGIIQ